MTFFYVCLCARACAVGGGRGERALHTLEIFSPCSFARQNWFRHHGDPGKKAPPRPPPWGASGDGGAWARAALLSGPPGVGKTTTAHLVARELGYDVMELNASDARSKKLLQTHLSDAMSSASLAKSSKKRVRGGETMTPCCRHSRFSPKVEKIQMSFDLKQSTRCSWQLLDLEVPHL